MSAAPFDLGSFVRQLLALPQTAAVALENTALPLLVTLCQTGAGQLGAMMDNKLMLAGPWEKMQPWLQKNLHLGPGARLVAHFKFPADKEMAVLTALDKLRRMHNLKPLLPANTWIFPPLTTDTGEPLGKLATVCTALVLS